MQTYTRIFQEPDPPVLIETLTDVFDQCQHFDGPVYFRGHAKESWSLTPTIGRIESIWHAGRRIQIHDLDRQEEYLLHRFRRHTYEHRCRILTVAEALLLARHYGLPVRLLDWTTNPLVALYWACIFQEDPEENGAVWWFRRQFRPERDIDVFDKRFDYKKIKGVRLIYPFYPTPRMTAQSAVFTIQEDPRKDLRTLNIDEYLSEHVDLLDGGKWTVLMAKKSELLEQLYRFGISARTLFPELDAVPRGLLESEAFRAVEQFP